MTKVLYVGQDPRTVDFTDPSLPAGLNAEIIRRGIDEAMANLRGQKWEATECMIAPNSVGKDQLVKALRSERFDCVVIGAGIRVPPKSLALFEDVMNLVHSHASQSSIAFNTNTADTVESVKRQMLARKN